MLKVVCEKCGHTRRRRHPDAECYTCKVLQTRALQICKCGGKKVQTAEMCKKCELTCDCGGLKKSSRAKKCLACIKKPKPATCIECGELFFRGTNAKGDPKRKTCSSDCFEKQRVKAALLGAAAVKALHAKTRESRLIVHRESVVSCKRSCICCGKLAGKKEFCSRCWTKLTGWAKRLDKKKACVICNTEFDNRSSQSESFCSVKCRLSTDSALNARRHAGHIRRVKVATATKHRFNIQSIYVRDNWQCVYCGCRVYNYEAGGHLSGDMATLDHVLPLSLGGEHVPDNVVTACWDCNTKKGSRFYAE
jgi:5-methylcytosine-specific restriction endonuclease McrA